MKKKEPLKAIIMKHKNKVIYSAFFDSKGEVDKKLVKKIMVNGKRVFIKKASLNLD